MAPSECKFMCIVCGATSFSEVVQKYVKGDVNRIMQVVRCALCGHIQLNPPNYSLDFYKEDGQVNFVVHDYGTPIEKIVEAIWRERHFP